MRERMTRFCAAIIVMAMAFALIPLRAVYAIGGSNEIALTTATTGGSLTGTLTCGGQDLLTAADPTITYGDEIICELDWSIPDGFALTTDDILVYDLPSVMDFEQKSGPIVNGSDVIGDYEIVGNQIRLNYTSADFCAEHERQGHLAFSGSVEKNPAGTTEPDDILISFEGIADITVHVVPPVSGAYLTVDKIFTPVDETNHIYSCRIPITATGDQTNIKVSDTMWPGMELYGGFPVIYSDSEYNNVFSDHTAFAFDGGDNRTFSCTIDSLADGQTVYMLYQVQVNDAMYDSAAGNQFVEDNNYTGDGNYYPWGYEGTVSNRVTVTSDEAQQPATKTTEIYASGYSFVKWYARPVGTELDRGVLRWQLFVNRINDSVSSGYIIDTLPTNNSFMPDSIWVYSGDDEVLLNASDYVTATTTVTASGETEVRFDFSEELLSKLRTVNTGMYIEYTTHVDSQTATEEHYTNTARLYYNDSLNSERAADTYYTKPAELEKVGTYNASTAPYANYTVYVNPAAMDLDPNNDTLTFTDTMGSALDLDTSSIRVNGVAPSADSMTYDPATHTFTIDLQDSTAYVVTYSAIVNLAPGSTLDDTNAVNTCALTGVVTNGGDGTFTINSRVYNNSASSSSIIGQVTLNVVKHDDTSTTSLLAGATFELSEAALNGNEVTSVTSVSSHTTDANGRVDFNSLTKGVCYMITETDAPDGYQLDQTPHFVIFAENSRSTYPATISYNGTVYNVEIIASTRASYDMYISNTAEPTPAETTPAETTPAETTPAETTPAETTPAETTPAETTPAETTPAETTPAETTPAETTPAETTPAETTPAETTPAETTPAETTPAETTPAETTPAETTPAETTPAETTPAETTPTETTPSETSATTSESTTTTTSESTTVTTSESTTTTTSESTSESTTTTISATSRETTTATTTSESTAASVDAITATTTTAAATTTTTESDPAVAGAVQTSATTTTEASARVAGAARIANEASETTTSAEADPTATATPTPASSGSSTVSTGESQSVFMIAGSALLILAAFFFITYVRKAKEEN